MIRLDQILDLVRTYAPDADLPVLRKAWVYAQSKHQGQTRKSGEPYFSHPLAVAHILAGLKMDVDSLATAILHDTVEDTDATLQEVSEQFGPTVAAMVDGVTKLDKLDFRSKEEAQAENFRKLVFAMAQDIRVVVVKLADRLHNMRTLGAMRADKRARIARETMDLYAPIANRLGIVSLKGELEDLSFQHLHPEAWDSLSRQVEARRPWFEAYIGRVRKKMLAQMTPAFPQVEVSGRVKSLWSIYQKMQDKALTFEEVHDLLAFRILVDDVGQCYGALGLVHAMWPPLSEKFKDYVAQPKANGYQSLHTTVMGPDRERIEVQIRTREMHDFCEMGIAAHWKYKEGHLALSPDEIDKITKVRQLLQWAEDIEDSREFLDVLRVDLYADQVHVYTPRGDVKWFPKGATTLDFAYSIHTEVGDTCTGGRVGGRLVRMGYILQPGDTVEIVTKSDQHPKKDWLELARTGRAITKIRQYLRRQERVRSIEQGRQLLDQELRRHGTSLKAATKKPGLGKALESLRMRSDSELFSAIGYGKVDASRLLPLYVDSERIDEEQRKAAVEEEESTAITLTGLFKRVARRNRSPVVVDGMDGMLSVFARCCAPLPGDAVVGYVSRGRGIVIHRSDCNQALSLPPERRVEVSWDNSHQAPHAARLHIVTVDRPLILAELTQAIGKMNVNITKAEARTTKEDRGHITLDVAVQDASQLRNLISRITRLKGVLSVDRAGLG